MIRKKINFIILILSLFSFSLKDVFAYEYIDFAHEVAVENMIIEVYDMKEEYEWLEGIEEEEEETEAVVEDVLNNYYWWPIGSVEVENVDGKEFANGDPETITLSSPFGNRPDPFGSGETVFHSGIDITGGRGMNMVSIIAAKDGTVVFSSKGGEVCPSGTQTSDCGGGYGNYIIIQHTDGNYSLYAHLYENSITVSEGESVKQGQVIAKMGSSGNSTGPHLHFEIREGQNEYAAAVDPLNYVDPNNPRPANVEGKVLDYINYWEGDEGIASNGEYLIADIGDGVSTVGHGVVLEYNAERFAAHGIDVNNYSVGDTLPIDIVDAVQAEEMSEARSHIESKLASNNITLKPHQIDALISFQYNCGPGAVDDFIENYKIYGDTQALYDNCMGNYVHVYGEVWPGLVRRRESEWNLFHNGVYDVFE